eukprot:gnl/MRDRNA2_/MRDRNA2_109514_c0_seq1.p1 gnl/MRDRNA2_/MRDRNA2_109514_c0~~gnl/MRDRNA2_/MRDRNA2_109514_c0_seq1.p1  ORF type:complete len:302 (-),score=65.95 gnl/MRDRNA2_/MRDRNA2_109514_c0_seq1:7-867(-)
MAAESEGRTKSLRQLDNDCKEADARSRRSQAEFVRRTKEVENLGVDIALVNDEAKNLEAVLADLRNQCDAERGRLDKLNNDMTPLLKHGGNDIDEKLKSVMDLTRLAEECRLAEQRSRRHRIRVIQRIEDLKRSVVEQRRMQKMLPGRIYATQSRAAELVARWTALGREVAEAEKTLDAERSSRAEEEKELHELRQTVEGLVAAMDFGRRRAHSVAATRNAQGQSFCMARQLEADELRHELANTRALLDKRLREVGMLRDSAFKNGLEIQALKGENITPSQRFCRR